MVKLRKTYDRWLEALCLDMEDKFVAFLRQTGRAVEIDNVVVDSQELFARHFTCDTTTCDPTLRGRAMRSCCCELTVDLTWDEARRIEEHLPDIRAVMEEAAQAPGLAVLDRGAFHVMADDFSPQLAKHRWGCVFAYREEGRSFRCAVHAAALRLGLPITALKPNICSLWPLALIEYQTGQYVLTALTDETGGLLEDDEQHARYACLKNDRKGPPLYREFTGLLAELFGAEFIARLDAEYERWEERERSQPAATAVPAQPPPTPVRRPRNGGRPAESHPTDTQPPRGRRAADARHR
jgi:hypothetical protein